MKVFRLDDIRFSKTRYKHKKPKGFRFRVFNRLTPLTEAKVTEKPSVNDSSKSMTCGERKE